MDDARGDANARATSRWAARADGVDDAAFVFDDDDDAFARVGANGVANGADGDGDLRVADAVGDERLRDVLPVEELVVECPADSPLCGAAAAAAASAASAAAALSSTRNETRNQVRPSRFASGYIARSAASMSAARGKPSAWASASVR